MNNVTNNVVSCSICSGTHIDDTINLTCGHAFGRSCIKSWMEVFGKTNCFLCPRELTIDEINKIADRSLSERMVIVMDKAIGNFIPVSFFCGLITTGVYAFLEFSGLRRMRSYDNLRSNATIGLEFFMCSAAGAAASSIVAGIRDERVIGAAASAYQSCWDFVGGAAAAVTGFAVGQIQALEYPGHDGSASPHLFYGFAGALAGMAGFYLDRTTDKINGR